MKIEIEIEKLKTAIVENGVDESTAQNIIAQLEQELLGDEKGEQPGEDGSTENNDPTGDEALDPVEKVDYEYLIILNDKDGHLKDTEIAGWVVQYDFSTDAALVLGKLKDAARDQNETAKKKNSRITSLEELFDGLKAKNLKDKNIKIKTKDLTRVIVSDGKF
jgi:hypothetical protein